MCAVHGGGPASAGGSPAREGGRPTEGGSNLVGVVEPEVEGEAAYFAAGEALREEAREVTGEGEGEAAAGGPVTAGGNCAARWQRAASSSTSDQRSCGATPSVVNGMAPPLRRRRGGGTCGYNARDQCFCVGWRAARRLSACASRCMLERLGPPSSPWWTMGQCHHIGHGGGGALSTSRGTAHHGRGGVGFHGWRRACLQRDGGQGQWWWEDCARSSIGEECVATMLLYTGGGAPRPVPIWARPSRSQPVRAAPVRVVVASHENDRRTIGQKHSRSTVRGAPVEDPRVAVHHHSTVALCPLPLGPILRPLQFCFVYLTLVSVVVSSVPTATGAKAMATRHADICAVRSAARGETSGHSRREWQLFEGRQTADRGTAMRARPTSF